MPYTDFLLLIFAITKAKLNQFGLFSLSTYSVDFLYKGLFIPEPQYHVVFGIVMHLFYICFNSLGSCLKWLSKAQQILQNILYDKIRRMVNWLDLC